jgi:hypothetical protein
MLLQPFNSVLFNAVQAFLPTVGYNYAVLTSEVLGLAWFQYCLVVVWFTV